MRPSVAVAFTMLVLCTVCATETFAQGHTIRGKVRNASGVNLSQTTVNLESGNGGLINQTVTNNEGDFIFSGLTETSYVIIITAPDYNPTAERVEFVRNVSQNEPGEIRTVELVLVRKIGASSIRSEVSFVQDVPKAARDSFETGARLLKSGDAKGGVASLQRSITIFPNYFDARFLLATELIKENRDNEAIVHLDQARQVNPKDARVFELFGTVMVKQQKYAVAARVFAEAWNLNPRELQYLVQQATALIDQAVRIDPATSSVNAEERAYALGEAEKTLNRAYQLSGKKLLVVHLQLARLYEKKGDRLRAANELEEYLNKANDDKNANEIRLAIRQLRASQKQ
jgi:Tfp pilus assembly protein PilF